MRNVMMFFGSCGHVDIEEIDDSQFIKLTTEPGHGGLGPAPPNHFKTGTKTRIVYVYPLRYCICLKCMQAVMDEELEIYDAHKEINVKLPSLDELFGAKNERD